MGDTGRVSTLRLRSLVLTDDSEARLAHSELASEGFDFLLGWHGQPWAEYLDELEGLRRGLGVPPGFVPATLLVAGVDGNLVGRVSIRHTLNAELARVGGHIGYGVRPAFRRHGYATAMLRQSLVRAHDLGITQALVTCDDGNAASTAVIERCGGRFDSLVPGDGGAPAKRRYWIDTPG